ncbi:PREDICTED: uncharacterized protein LOC106808546 [Priapulus caudatus]|uniref:Uncharacterized protein LOC106808546 n=1 Tax=Priapulus caudatus TaxID=37621 RepID=A0ABM1E3M2_PRICU|nr:PREDICTED: uncharacterized protein LOC106808546 [Priapulus caudatus]
MYHFISEDSPFCALKAKVTPSQRLRDKPHLPWVYIDKSTASVFCGHCTCMAGLGEVCSHVAALLLKVETGVKLGLTVKSSTSQACEWNKAFRKDIQPATVADSHAILKGARKKTVTSVSGTGKAPLPDDAVLLTLKQACPDAVFFDTIYPIGDDGEDTDSAEEEERCETYPQTLTSISDPEFSGDLTKRCTDVWSRYQCSELQVANLERRTLSQSVCPLWFEHRKGRITGTKAHSVVHRRETTDPCNLIRQIVGYVSMICLS